MSGATSRLTSVGLAALVALAIVPGLVGSASAASVAAIPGSAAATSEWAYGGEGWAAGSLSNTTLSVSWNASFGLVVIFNATNTSAHVTELRVERTIAITLTASGSTSNASAHYDFHAMEHDVAYANLTNNANVTLGNGSTVAAIGLLNASASAVASLDESAQVTLGALSLSASFHVAGHSHTTVGLAPALGLVPIDLANATSWNSSAIATPVSSWGASYNYQSPNGTGSGSFSGGWNATSLVSLSGAKVVLGVPHWHDNETRVGVILVITGPFHLYDAVILVPGTFDFFGSGSHSYNGSFGGAAIGEETAYVNAGPIRGHSFTAAGATFGLTGGILASHARGTIGPAVGAVSSPGATVVAQPETPSQARSQANCLQFGCGATAGLNVLDVGLILGAVAIVGLIGAVGWRARSRRRSQQPPAGTLGQWSPGGVTPPASPSTPSPPTPPNLNEPATPGDSNRPF